VLATALVEAASAEVVAATVEEVVEEVLATEVVLSAAVAVT
jgi:hypothetical protein